MVVDTQANNLERRVASPESRDGYLKEDGHSVLLYISSWEVIYRPPGYDIKQFCKNLKKLVEELHNNR